MTYTPVPIKRTNRLSTIYFKRENPFRVPNPQNSWKINSTGRVDLPVQQMLHTSR